MPVTPATIDSLGRIPLLQTLAIAPVEIGERHALTRVVVDERHRNYYGGAHGGLIATLVDTTSFFPRPLAPAGRELATIQLSVTYVRAARVGDTLTSRADVLHLGRRTASLSIRITDQEDRLVAHGSTTLMFLDADATR